MEGTSSHPDHVGPVLSAGCVADAVIAAIRELNASALIVDRGSYVRVLVPHRCIVTREAVESHLGRPFRLPRDLEAVMSALKGTFEVSEDRAVWKLDPRVAPGLVEE